MNTFGNIFRLTTFGESHGSAVGGVIDGCPSGIILDLEKIQKQVWMRSPESVAGSTSRKEKDKIEFLSGIFDGKTLGTPLAFIIKNEDVRSEDYSNIEHIFRPGHADYTYQMRYGIRDYRGGGRASARETVVRVVAGAIAEQLLYQQNITIEAYVDQIGDITIPKKITNPIDPYSSLYRCPDKYTESKWERLLESIKKDNDSIGGAVKCIIKGMPAGVGEPIFDKVQSRLAAAMMSIPAAKGFEYGQGMNSARMKGSESNDEMEIKDNRIQFKTNRCGGLLGGITTREDIYFRVAFKPVSSIGKLQNTINDRGENVEIQIEGRHDVCVAPRAVAVVKAMTALVVIDQILSRN